MNAPWTKMIDGRALHLLRQAGKALDDDLWWAFSAQAATCGDDRAALACLDLAIRVSHQAVERHSGPPVLPTIQETLPLLRSGIEDAIMMGSRCIRHIASLNPGAELDVEGLFRAVPVRARELMLMHATRRGQDEASSALIRRGLTDRSRRVRLVAAVEAEKSDSPSVLEAVRAAKLRESDPELLQWMRKSESKISKGYWVGAAAYGSCDVELRYGVSMSVPAATIQQFGEEEVIRRLQRIDDGIMSPTFAEDERWLSEQNDRWRASSDFAEFQRSMKRAEKAQSASDPQKRQAIVAGLPDIDSKFVDAARFLDGNEDEGSIGCNLVPHPGIAVFRLVVAKLLTRRDVSGAFVEIREVLDAPAWPFTDSLLLCTSAGVREVQVLVRRLRPDSVSGATGEVPFPAPAGFRWLLVWWD